MWQKSLVSFRPCVFVWISGQKLGLVPTDVWSTGRQSTIALARGIICALAIEYLGISGREVSRQLHLSPSAVSKLLQRGQKNGLTETLSGALFRKHW
jgi:hypothetical protein